MDHCRLIAEFISAADTPKVSTRKKLSEIRINNIQYFFE